VEEIFGLKPRRGKTAFLRVFPYFNHCLEVCNDRLSFLRKRSTRATVIERQPAQLMAHTHTHWKSN